MKYLDVANQFKSLSSRARQYELTIDRKEIDYEKKIELIKGEIFRLEERLVSSIQKKSNSKSLAVNLEYLKSIFGPSAKFNASSINLKIKSKANNEKAFNEAVLNLQNAVKEFELKSKDNAEEIDYLNEIIAAKRIMSGIFFYAGDLVDCNDSDIKKILNIGWFSESFSSKRRNRKEYVKSMFSAHSRVMSKTKIKLTDPSVNFQGFVKDVRDLMDKKIQSEKKIEEFKSGLDSEISKIDSLKDALYRARNIMDSNTMERAFSEMMMSFSSNKDIRLLASPNHFQMIREKNIKIEILKKISEQFKHEKKFSRDMVELVNDYVSKYMGLHHSGYQYWEVGKAQKKEIEKHIESSQKLIESKTNWISNQLSSVSMLKISESDTSDPNVYIGMLITAQGSSYMSDCAKIIMKEELNAIQYSIKKSETSLRERKNTDNSNEALMQSAMSLNVISTNVDDKDSLASIGRSIDNMHSSENTDFGPMSGGSSSAFQDSHNAMHSDGAISSVMSAISSSVSSMSSSCSGSFGGDSGGSDGGGGGCD